MYFWDSRRLAVDLRNDAVSPAQLKNYLIAFLFIGIPGSFHGLVGHDRIDGWNWVVLIGTLGITLFGVLRAYQANGGDQGSRFVEKSVALILPLTIQYVVLGSVAFIVGSLLERAWVPLVDARTDELLTNALSTFTTLGLLAWLFWRLADHMPDTIHPGPDASWVPDADRHRPTEPSPSD